MSLRGRFGALAVALVVILAVCVAPTPRVAGASVRAGSFGPPVVHGPCKPAMVTIADIASATGFARTNLLTDPHPAGAIPPAAGMPTVAGKGYMCDWELVHWNEAGFGEGRVSLFVFASPDDASHWFSAYTAAERPSCKPVSVTTPACVQVSPISPTSAFPLFQSVQGQYVVWIHMKQRKLSLRTLEVLATKVLSRAPQLP